MITDIFAKHTCTYCQEEIKTLCVKCVECSSMELCLQCFSCGAEIGTHKRDHAYQFMDSVVCDVFRDCSGWSAREEVYLLNAIEHYSYGNWKDVSQYIGTRTAEESRDEYISRFLGGEIGRHTWVPSLRSKCTLNDLTQICDRDSKPETDEESNKAVLRKTGLDWRFDDLQQLNYMPLRDEFDVEYDNEAESIVSHLTFNVDDDELEIALKQTQVEIYTHRLRERKQRKRIVQDNNLISMFFNRKDKFKKKLTKEEKEFEERFKPFYKFKGNEPAVLMGITKQRKLMQKLADYLRYRRNGLIQLEEIAHFLQERPNCPTPNPMAHSSEINTLQFSTKNKKEEEKSETFTNMHLESAENSILKKKYESEDLLSSNENKICHSLDLTPTQYISIKAVLLADTQVEPEERSSKHILDYLVSSGWVNNVVTATES